MASPIVQSRYGITLLAGGPVARADLRAALDRAPCLVAADGGADRALAAGLVPEAVIGDLDSIGAAARARLSDRLHPIAEQDTTDFDKALRSIRAPFVVAVGALGGRLDHALAVLNALVRQPGPPCLLLGGGDAVFAAPAGRDLALRLRRGDRLSLFPLAPVTGESRGLRWPLGGIGFAPAGRIGTSNVVDQPDVRLRLDAAGMLVILPRRRLDAALAALRG